MQVEPPSSLAKSAPSWKTVLNWTLPVVLISIFAWQLHGNWSEIDKYPWEEINWGLASLAVALLLLNSFTEILIWNKTLGWFTNPLPFVKAAPVYIWSSLARYVPGKFASLLLRVALAAEVNRKAIPVLASSTAELALRIASGLVLLLIALFGSGSIDIPTLLVAPPLVILLVLICAHPRIMLPTLNWALKKANRAPIAQELKYLDVLGVFVAIFFRWIIYGAAFVLFACAIFPAAFRHAIILASTAAGSWAIGFILLSPGGLGWAEIVQKKIINDALHFPIAVALVLPILFRLGTLLSEGIWALAAMAMRKSWREQ